MENQLSRPGLSEYIDQSALHDDGAYRAIGKDVHASPRRSCCIYGHVGTARLQRTQDRGDGRNRFGCVDTDTMPDADTKPNEVARNTFGQLIEPCVAYCSISRRIHHRAPVGMLASGAFE